MNKKMIEKIKINIITTCDDCPAYVFQGGGTGLCLNHWRQIHKKDEKTYVPEWCWLPEINMEISVKEAIQKQKEASMIASKKSKEIKSDKQEGKNDG